MTPRPHARTRRAAAICLLANTSPVAFGSIGIPLVMLQNVTGLPMMSISANVGRICAPLALIVPAYLMLVMGGMKALTAVWPAAAMVRKTSTADDMGPAATGRVNDSCTIPSPVVSP